MTIDDIVACMSVIGVFNPNMMTLYEAFVREAEGVPVNKAVIDEAEERGQPIYETIVIVQIGLANAIHDYVYNVVRPFDSVMIKNVCREQICRQVFELPSEF